MLLNSYFEMSPLDGENANSSESVTPDSAESLNPAPKVENEVIPSCLPGTQQQQQLQQQQQTCGNVAPILKYTPMDFVFWKIVGEGSFSTVFLATGVRDGKDYAIKVCDKRHIAKERKKEYVQRERDALSIINSSTCVTCPFVVKLFHTFQDDYRLYFVLTHARNGDMQPYISNGKKFDEKCTKFYAAEILCALEHMHRSGIIHRDLKPENILLNERMHILLTDFGSVKLLDQSLDNKEGPPPNHRSRAGSFVGTAQYVSPELLNDQSVSFASDLWALGCIIYQMMEGCSPFFGRSEPEIFQKIRKLELTFEDSFEPKAKDLILKLLVLDASSRLGALDIGRYVSVRSHSLFVGVEFESLHQKTAPLQPFSTVEESEKFDPSSVRPGLDNKQFSRLLGLSLHDGVSTVTSPSCKVSIATILKSPEKIRERLNKQIQNNEWHMLVEGNLILRYGIVIKKKGLLPKKRVLLLTTGPHLYYADPVNRVLKGQVPWSSDLHEEAKNFKTFFVHTPERSFRWDDPEGNALVWCEAIKQVRKHSYENAV